MLINLATIPVQTTSNYPAPFQAQVAGRQKQRLGDAAGLTNFGVNWVTLAPGSASALRHWHQRQDEFIYVVSGELMLVTDEGETPITAGMMAAFPASEANGHHLVNRSASPAVYLEVGDRTPVEQVQYPDEDLVAHQTSEGWAFSHRDVRPYSDATHSCGLGSRGMTPVFLRKFLIHWGWSPCFHSCSLASAPGTSDFFALRCHNLASILPIEIFATHCP